MFRIKADRAAGTNAASRKNHNRLLPGKKYFILTKVKAEDDRLEGQAVANVNTQIKT